MITSKEQYDWAVARVEELLPKVTDETPVTDPASIELSLLSSLVADYSDEHFDIGEPDLPSVLKMRMAEMDLSQKELAEKIGVSPARISEYVNGKAEPTLAVARRLCHELNINPGIILGL